MNGMLAIYNQIINPPNLINQGSNGDIHRYNGIEGTLNFHCKAAKVGNEAVTKGMKSGLTLTQSIDKAVANKGNKANAVKHPYKGGMETVGFAAKDQGLKPSYINNTMRRKGISLEAAVDFLNARKATGKQNHGNKGKASKKSSLFII